jgi:hypothetical protein
MPPALTPALALEYVHELSADVRAALVLDAAGAVLAGPAHLAEPARALLAAAGAAAEVESGGADGVVCAVRSDAHAAVAVCGRFVIGGVVRQDLRAALAALEGRPPRSGPAAEPAPAAGASRGPAGSRTAAEPAPHTGPVAAPGDDPDPALERAAEALISALQRGSEA